MALQERIPTSFSTNLIESMQWSRLQMQGSLNKRMEMLRQVVGKHYGARGCRERIPMPFLRLYLNIISHYLVSRSPSALIECRDARYRSLVRQTKIWAGQYFSHVNLEDILRKWTYESLLYGVSFCKICPPYEDERYQGHAYGPDDMQGSMVYPVDPERMVFDMAATEWDMLDYIGHRVTVDKNEMWGDGWDEERVADLNPDMHTLQNERGGEKSEALSLEAPDWGRKLRPYIDFWEIYLPKENLTVGYPVIGNTIDSRPIYVKEYVGPRGRDFPTGPYTRQIMEHVPGQLLGNPPVSIIYDMHIATNRMMRKLLRQADRQKDLTMYASQFEDEAKKIRDTDDGGMIPVTSPGAFSNYRTGGPDNLTMNFMLNSKQQVDYFGGNISIMGGLGSQSPTLGQDELLSGAASQQLRYLQQEMLSCVRPVMKSILWHKWNSDEVFNYTETVPGTNMQFPWEIRPESRRGLSFEQMSIQVHPYSMQPVTPQMRVAQLRRLFQETILPALPIMQAQNITFDFQAYLRNIVELEGIEQYAQEILHLMPLPEEMAMQNQQAGGQQQAPRVRPPGTGQYTRTNVGVQNPDEALMQAASQVEAPEQGEAA